MARRRHLRQGGLRRAFLAALLFALLSPTLFSLGVRAPWALPGDFTEARYLCAHDIAEALDDLSGRRDPEKPLFQDPSCSLCVVLASAVCPGQTFAAPLPALPRYDVLRPAEALAPVLARIALPPGARGPPALL